MTARAYSVALIGVDGAVVEVEAHVGGGLPRTVLVGLPDASLYEARDRCKAALQGCGMKWPEHLVTINLSPATLPKSGSHYDLAIIAAVLAAEGAAPPTILDGTVMLGEVGLTGLVRPIRGLLPALLAAAAGGFTRAVVPATQLAEAAVVPGLELFGVETLGDFASVLEGGPGVAPASGPVDEPQAQVAADFADVTGQAEAKWAMEVAAAGRHHVLLNGPPGVGKTMLAVRLPGILPPLSDEEALEVTAIHSLAGLPVDSLVRTAPLADPHHGASLAAMVGGGSRVIRPGAISLAHRGILFLDEACEFGPRVLDALRTPLESGQVHIARADAQARFPAAFQLVLATNPCPCGLAGTRGASCRCQPMAVRRYRERLSGPVLDRVDIRLTLHAQSAAVMKSAARGESSATIAARVVEARHRQLARLRGTPWRTNAEVPGAHLRKLATPAGMDLVEQALRRGQLSNRGVDKVWRVAWTIADLQGHDRVSHSDVATALAMRMPAEVAA